MSEWEAAEDKHVNPAWLRLRTSVGLTWPQQVPETQCKGHTTEDSPGTQAALVIQCWAGTRLRNSVDSIS